MENSGIEWCHHTGNTVIGCQAVHDGCDNCYADAQDHRWGGKHFGVGTSRKEVKSFFVNMMKFQTQAAALGEIHRVFVGSMMDIFEVPRSMVDSRDQPVMVDGVQITSDVPRQKFFANISNGMYPNLLFLLLTKRPGNIKKYIPEAWKYTPPLNVMYGCSPVDQLTANDMIPKLLEVAGRHFISYEPALGAIDMLAIKARMGGMWNDTNNQIDWVIAGAESGPKARPAHPEWFKSLKDQCRFLDIPYLFKQWGEWAPVEDHKNCLAIWPDGMVQHLGKDDYGMVVLKEGVAIMGRVGKGSSGNLLDGKQYLEFPEFIQYINGKSTNSKGSAV